MVLRVVQCLRKWWAIAKPVCICSTGPTRCDEKAPSRSSGPALLFHRHAPAYPATAPATTRLSTPTALRALGLVAGVAEGPAPGGGAPETSTVPGRREVLGSAPLGAASQSPATDSRGNRSSALQPEQRRDTGGGSTQADGVDSRPRRGAGRCRPGRESHHRTAQTGLMGPNEPETAEKLEATPSPREVGALKPAGWCVLPNPPPPPLPPVFFVG